MDAAQFSDENTKTDQVTVDDIEVDILPYIYDVLRSIERDTHDSNQKIKESSDTSQKILELQKRFDIIRAQIKKLPGIDQSKEEQLKTYENLRRQLELKKQLLLKYKNLGTL